MPEKSASPNASCMPSAFSGSFSLRSASKPKRGRSSVTSYSLPLPTRCRSRAKATRRSAERSISCAADFCSRASVARNQLLATIAASDCAAYSESSAAETYWSCAASRPARTRPQRSSSQFANTPTPSRPLESPLIVPPPRASRLTCGYSVAPASLT